MHALVHAPEHLHENPQYGYLKGCPVDRSTGPWTCFKAGMK
jgi:hypothetical protein